MEVHGKENSDIDEYYLPRRHSYLDTVFVPTSTDFAFLFQRTLCINEARTSCYSFLCCLLPFAFGLFWKCSLRWLGGSLGAVLLVSWQFPWKMLPLALPSLPE